MSDIELSDTHTYSFCPSVNVIISLGVTFFFKVIFFPPQLTQEGMVSF